MRIGMNFEYGDIDYDNSVELPVQRKLCYWGGLKANPASSGSGVAQVNVNQAQGYVAPVAIQSVSVTPATPVAPVSLVTGPVFSSPVSQTTYASPSPASNSTSLADRIAANMGVTAIPMTSPDYVTPNVADAFPGWNDWEQKDSSPTIGYTGDPNNYVQYATYEKTLLNLPKNTGVVMAEIPAPSQMVSDLSNPPPISPVSPKNGGVSDGFVISLPGGNYNVKDISRDSNNQITSAVLVNMDSSGVNQGKVTGGTFLKEIQKFDSDPILISKNSSKGVVSSPSSPSSSSPAPSSSSSPTASYDSATRIATMPDGTKYVVQSVNEDGSLKTQKVSGQDWLSDWLKATYNLDDPNLIAAVKGSPSPTPITPSAPTTTPPAKTSAPFNLDFLFKQTSNVTGGKSEEKRPGYMREALTKENPNPKDVPIYPAAYYNETGDLIARPMENTVGKETGAAAGSGYGPYSDRGYGLKSDGSIDLTKSVLLTNANVPREYGKTGIINPIVGGITPGSSTTTPPKALVTPFSPAIPPVITPSATVTQIQLKKPDGSIALIDSSSTKTAYASSPVVGNWLTGNPELSATKPVTYYADGSYEITFSNGRGYYVKPDGKYEQVSGSPGEANYQQADSNLINNFKKTIIAGSPVTSPWVNPPFVIAPAPPATPVNPATPLVSPAVSASVQAMMDALNDTSPAGQAKLAQIQTDSYLTAKAIRESDYDQSLNEKRREEGLPIFTEQQLRDMRATREANLTKSTFPNFSPVGDIDLVLAARSAQNTADGKNADQIVANANKSFNEQRIKAGLPAYTEQQLRVMREEEKRAYAKGGGDAAVNAAYTYNLSPNKKLIYESSKKYGLDPTTVSSNLRGQGTSFNLVEELSSGGSNLIDQKTGLSGSFSNDPNNWKINVSKKADDIMMTTSHEMNHPFFDLLSENDKKAWTSYYYRNERDIINSNPKLSQYQSQYRPSEAYAMLGTLTKDNIPAPLRRFYPQIFKQHVRKKEFKKSSKINKRITF